VFGGTGPWRDGYPSGGMVMSQQQWVLAATAFTIVVSVQAW
jgi:hypothetical protein